jgi:hypothetical protein
MRMLLKRGTPRAQAEDIIQDVAVRALAHEPRFEGPADLLPWASTVARNVSSKQFRNERRRAWVPFEEHLDPGSGTSVEDRVLHILRAEAVLSALDELTARELEVLIPLMEPAPDRQTQVGLAVRRHRARERLAKIVGGLGAVGTGWLRWLRSRRVAPVAATLIGVVAIAMVFTLRSDGGGQLDDQQALAPRALEPISGTPVASPRDPHDPSRRFPPAVAPIATSSRVSARMELPVAVPGISSNQVLVNDHNPTDPPLCFHLPGLPTVCSPRT